MIPAIVSQLPYLVVLLAGVAIALDRKHNQPQLSKWALLCYGVLIVLWVMRMAQIGWMIRAHQQGIHLEDYQTVLMTLGYARMVIHYGVLLAIMVGALRWREENSDALQKPGILIGVSVFLTIAGIVLARILTGAGPWLILVLICELGSMITLMVALYGWRRDEAVSASFAGPFKQVQDIPKPSGVVQTTPQPASLPQGMFEEKDYIPFVLGVMVLGGLVCVPLLWGQFTALGFEKSIVPSLISCGIFVYAHDNRGNFSILKFIFGLVFVFMIVMRAIVQSAGNAKPMFFVGGIVGYIIMFACGWAGIALARFLRR